MLGVIAAQCFGLARQDRENTANTALWQRINGNFNYQ